MLSDREYRVAHDLGDRIGVRPSTSALGAADQLVSWVLGPVTEREPGGNACMGIAIGCALSLPVWLGVLITYLLLA